MINVVDGKGNGVYLLSGEAVYRSETENPNSAATYLSMSPRRGDSRSLSALVTACAMFLGTSVPMELPELFGAYTGFLELRFFLP